MKEENDSIPAHIEDIIIHGVTFRGKTNAPSTAGKVKTKAKKKSYITGGHQSASAKMKADIRKKRANRASQKKGR